MVAAQPILASDHEKAAHFTSFEALNDQRKRKVTPAVGPRDVYRSPMTLMDEVYMLASYGNSNGCLNNTIQSAGWVARV